MSAIKMEDIVSLCKRRGFIYQGSEIYGGLAGTWDYGPLGVTLKRNIMSLWWKMFVDDRDDMYGVDAAILMNQKVWQASGHATGFVDPTVVDIISGKAYRADHLLDELGIDINGMNLDAINHCIQDKKLKSPDGNALSTAFWFNMMFKTHTGASALDIVSEHYESVEGKLIFRSKDSKSVDINIEKRKDTNSATFYDSNLVSYLRPETAQGIFTNYKNIVDTSSPDMPFGIAQQGKAFRNEISPRDFIFRSREFEQMEVEYFIHPNDWEAEFEKWIKNIYEFLKAIGLSKDSVHELEVPDSDRAHYSKRTIDFEYDFPIGRKELLGLAYRTDFDLINIQNNSGKSMDYRPKDGSDAFVPHVIEPSFGVERTLMAVLTNAYTEDEVNGEKRVYLKLPTHLAPIKVAVSPLLKNKPELVKKACEVYDMLKNPPKDMPELRSLQGGVVWDDNGNIGKRYRRQDEIGTPYCVVVDFDTLEDDTVTIRHRDTTKQQRIKISEIASVLI